LKFANVQLVFLEISQIFLRKVREVEDSSDRRGSTRAIHRLMVALGFDVVRAQ